MSKSKRKRRIFTEEFKKQSVQLYLNGKPKSEIKKEYDLYPSTLNYWIKQHQEIGIVTGLANMGTGVFSSLGSSISDFFGQQSNIYNSKIQQSEEFCMQQLRLKTLKKGGNAVIGVDIDYNEIGGTKEMQMVAMIGTTVHLLNIEDVIDEMVNIEEYNKRFKEYRNLLKKLDELK